MMSGQEATQVSSAMGGCGQRGRGRRAWRGGSRRTCPGACACGAGRHLSACYCGFKAEASGSGLSRGGLGGFTGGPGRG